METLDLKGYTVRIEPDSYPENPWEFSDCNPPAIVCAGNRPTCHGIESWGDLLPDSVPDEVRENLRDEMPVNWGSQCAPRIWLDRLAEVLNAAGVDCKVCWRYGGGRTAAHILVAATPEWREKTGIRDEHIPGALEAMANGYAAWAWGDVYGVASITAPDGRDLDVSCWGFYGSDHEASGLLDFAISEVAADMRYLEKLADAEKENAACMI